MPKGPENPLFCDFPPLEVQSTKTQTVKKLRNFGEKLLGRTDFPPKVPLGHPGPKWPETPVPGDFPPLGVRLAKA